MFGKLKSGSLISASWQIVKKEKRIVYGNMIGSAVSLVLFALGAFLLYRIGSFNSAITSESTDIGFDLSPIGTLFLITYMTFLSIIPHLVGAYITIISLARFRGETISSSEAYDRLKQNLKGIVLFSILSSTVGLILNMLQDKIPFVGGKVLAWIGSVAWGIAAMFGVAVTVDQNQNNPIKAVKESARIVKKTFGDNIKVNFVLFPVILLLSILTVIISGLVGTLASVAGFSDVASVLSGGLVFIIITLVTMVITSSIQAVISAGLYEYAVSGKTPESFNAEMFKQAINTKKAKKIFSRA